MTKIIFKVILLLTMLSCVAENNTVSDVPVPEGFTSDYDPFSDGWCIDLAAYHHPDWKYDKLEDYVFASDSVFINKYEHEKN